MTDGSSPKPKHCTYRLVGDNFCALTHLISTAALLHSRSENEYRKKCWSDRYILIGAMVAATAGEFSMRYTTCLVSRKPCPDSQRSPRHHVSRIHYPIFKFGSKFEKRQIIYFCRKSTPEKCKALNNIYNTLQQHVRDRSKEQIFSLPKRSKFARILETKTLWYRVVRSILAFVCLSICQKQTFVAAPPT